ncbi:hypothetical protein A1Q1_06805 [Trichosporon asahii var. asahii CBS 2479]|uniref:RING-type domain-containing protein n=1 Tax=Trichosporon asahii var. asahii (strain ATCC 90039 / CBS 2479 / JCM 2466 / KCTC 7840 / NBRC 103889/ NCYC 2677 / UAMH 7654) TaxID=1186058 RepID=J5TP88_TRIAS|nr:hypothetical protein A1Q1_06805 [Trichosporon asahii var. asahii CBS 2479]EJT51936.1 hypothetical protein A1Q1_06805 [Trichosporon asahii var. asahii CBS 2479]
MSSPSNEGGPPPDPPHPPDAPHDTPIAHDAAHAEAGPSTPQPHAPPAPTVEDELEASRPDSGTAGSQQSSENTNTPPNPSQSPPQHQGRRPLYSLTHFIPMATRPGEGGPGNGERVGLTWTLEVFANDGEGDDDLPTTDQNDRPQPPAGANTDGTDGSAAAAVLAAAEAEAAAREAGGAADQNATGAPNAPNAEGNANGNGNGPERAERRSMIFVVGPDGLIPRPGQEDAGPAPFAFPFPFLPFMMQPAGPDPAKAAELLASLPTVRRALLRRVDKVVAAEDASNGKEYDERGWRCGICLEGIEEELTDGPIPVKALPCNHLFHGPCLEPWFSSHHTCPTCRLDLDPLRTLNDPRETRRNPLRPAPTGSGRGTPAGGHPYARGRDRDRSGLRSGQQTPAEPVEGQEPQTPQGGQDEPPTPPGLMELARITAQNLARGLFGGLTTGSPLPMDRDQPQERERTPMGPERPPGMQPAQPAAAGPAPGGDTPAHTSGSASATGSPNPGGRPTPERRSHISVIHLGPPPFGHRPFAAPPNPFQHLFGRPPGSGADEQPRPAGEADEQPNLPEQSNEATEPATAATSTSNEQAEPSAESSTSGEGASSEPSARVPTPQAEPTDPPAAEPNREGANATPAPANDGEAQPRPFRGFPLELLFLQMGAPEPPAPPPAEERPASTFVPQSLESWTEQREKTLGWRCDAVECLVAPPVPDGDGEDMDVDEAPAEVEEEDVLPAADKEMLSIYSAQQPLFPPSREGEEAHANAEFVLLTCPHRWHRTCLEVAERSAGHSGLPDGDGRQWVRCMTCRKEGWVVPRTPTPPQPEAPVTADV